MWYKVQWLLLVITLLLGITTINRYRSSYSHYKQLKKSFSSLYHIEQTDIQTLITQDTRDLNESMVMTPYQFIIEVRNIILSNQLEIKGYRIFYNDDFPIVEFQVAGAIDEYFTLIYYLHTNSILVSQLELSLMEKGNVYVSLQIPYTNL